MNIILIILLTAFDALMYGYFYEKKKYKLLFIFWELSYKGKTVLPVYRIIQGVLDGAALYILYINYGVIPLVGFVLAWYLMLKEYLYYIMLWQWQILLNYETYVEDTYWLKRIYFSGYWLFKNGFKFWRFTLSAAIGLALLIISNVI